MFEIICIIVLYLAALFIAVNAATAFEKQKNPKK